MAVAHDAVSESHTGTTGNASEASFTWNHVPTGTPRGAVVFVLTVGAAAAQDYSTSVTYGGATMTKVPYTARDSDTELGAVAAYWLDNVASGTQAVVVNRTNNTAVMYAACFTVTAAGEIEVDSTLVKTRAGSAAEQTAASSNTGGVASSWSSIALDDGSPGTNSVRFMGVYSGAASVSTAGTGTTAGPSIDFGNYVFGTYRETSASQGSTTLTITTAISDDLAVLGFAVREKPASGTQYTAWFVNGSSGHTRDANGGALTFSGTDTAQTRRSLAAGLTFAGSRVAQVARSLAAGLTFAGSAPKQAQRALAGALSSAGSLVSAKFSTVDLSAALSFAGDAVRRVDRLLEGAIGSAGGLGVTLALARTLTGGLDFAGAVIRDTARSLTGDLSFAGAVTTSRVILRTLTSTLLFRGTNVSPPTYVSSTVGGAAAVDTISVAKPSGIQSGDFIIVAIGANTTNHIWYPPSGWTALTASTYSSTTGIYLYYKFASDDEAESATWDFLDDYGTFDADWVCGVYRGVRRTSPVLASAISSSGSSTAVTLGPSNPAIPGAEGGTLVARAVAVAYSLQTTRPSWSQNWGVITSGTERQDGGVVKSVMLADGQVTTGAASPYCQVVGVSGFSKVGALFTLAGASKAGVLSRRSYRALAGSLATSGLNTIKTTMVKAATSALTFTGSAAKEARRPLAGVLDFTGAAASEVRRTLAGVLDFATDLASQTVGGVIQKALDATLSLTGTFDRVGSFVRPFTASVGLAGSSAKAVTRSLSASLSSSGSLDSMRFIVRALAAALTFAGSSVRQVRRPVAASLTLAGTSAKEVRRSLAATLSSSASLGTVKVLLRTLTAGLTFAGAQTRRAGKALAASIVPVGSISKRVTRSLAGALTSAGSVAKQARRSVAGAVSFAGSQTRRTGKALAASLSPSGSLGRALTLLRTFTASLSPSGFLNSVKTGMVQVNLTGVLTFTGAIVRQPRKALAATLGTVGSMARRTYRALAAGLTPAGSLQKRLGRPLTAVLTLSGGMVRQTRKALSGALGLAGSMVTADGRLIKAFSAVVGFSGSVARQTRKTLTANLGLAGVMERVRSRLRGSTAARLVGDAVSRLRGSSTSRASGASGLRDRGPTAGRDNDR
jgi:hypothetical protein